jgi:hypothetical protein
VYHFGFFMAGIAAACCASAAHIDRNAVGQAMGMPGVAQGTRKYGLPCIGFSF